MTDPLDDLDRRLAEFARHAEALAPPAAAGAAAARRRGERRRARRRASAAASAAAVALISLATWQFGSWPGPPVTVPPAHGGEATPAETERPRPVPPPGLLPRPEQLAWRLAGRDVAADPVLHALREHCGLTGTGAPPARETEAEEGYEGRAGAVADYRLLRFDSETEAAVAEAWLVQPDVAPGTACAFNARTADRGEGTVDLSVPPDAVLDLGSLGIWDGRLYVVRDGARLALLLTAAPLPGSFAGDEEWALPRDAPDPTALCLTELLATGGPCRPIVETPSPAR
ncbi:hypothetical protein RM780_08345 [Streptomyces sp. DSM 44917]|uniref:Uncharacterized protein n=1 Tax=Streptomyces boetiae TaxID=3075541 RepID=A0ABU2L6M6_9ACTN|nr:hypothetical protein [Streptomyces sp. DSM 44917]MDT0306973.1 hypothetical protein [Streptomyces sp. DSM 44917]